MEGKRYIPKVKALLNIPNVVDAGKVYNLNELKNWYPYLDFKNKEYFQEVFEGAIFKVGDKVKWIGVPRKYYIEPNPNPNVTYVITKVVPQIKNNLVYFYYDIVDSNNSDSEFSGIEENNLASAPDKWIVSFSASKDKYHPDVHKIDFSGYNNKIRGTWKEMFVFDSQKEALDAANLFAQYTIKEMMEKLSND